MLTIILNLLLYFINKKNTQSLRIMNNNIFFSTPHNSYIIVRSTT